jgi:hypothetical protein
MLYATFLKEKRCLRSKEHEMLPAKKRFSILKNVFSLKHFVLFILKFLFKTKLFSKCYSYVCEWKWGSGRRIGEFNFLYSFMPF